MQAFLNGFLSCVHFVFYFPTVIVLLYETKYVSNALFDSVCIFLSSCHAKKGEQLVNDSYNYPKDGLNAGDTVQWGKKEHAFG